MKVARALTAGSARMGALGLIIPVLLVVTVMGRLDAVLADMHLAGAQAGSVTSIADPLTDRATAERVRSGWADWDLERRAQDREAESSTAGEDDTGAAAAQGGGEARTPGAVQPVPPGTVAAWWLVLDTLLLAPLLALGLILLIGSRERALQGVGEQDGPARQAVLAVLGRARWMVGLYLVADWIENGLSLVSLTGDLEGGYDAIGGIRLASGVKVAAFTLVLLPILISLTWASLTALRQVRALRAQAVGAGLVFALLVVASGDVGNQLADVARSWPDHPGEVVAAAVLFGALSALIWLSGARTLALDAATDPGEGPNDPVPPEEGQGPGWRAHAFVVVTEYRVPLAAGFLSFAGLRVTTDVPWEVAGLPFGLVGAYIVLAGVVPSVWALEGHREPVLANWVLLGLLAYLPLLALALLWIRAETGLADWWGRTGVVALLVVLALAVLWEAIGRAVLHRAATVAPPRTALWWATVLAVLAAVAVPSAWAARDAIAAGRVFGALGYIAVLALWVTLALTGAVLLLDRRPPGRAFALMRLRHFPVITLTLVLLVAASVVHTEPGFHRARLLDVPGPSQVARQGETLKAALDAWLEESGEDETTTGYEPLFVVAASGGAARSAYWTMLSLECLFGERVGQGEGSGDNVYLPACSGPAGGLDQVMLASGISGGSVGLTMYAASTWADADEDFDEEAPFRGPSLAPVAASLATGDLLNSYAQATEVGLPFADRVTLQDRAAALEQEWESHLPLLEDGFFATQLAGERGNFPRLMLNSASVEDGCVFNTSVLDLAAGDVVAPEEATGFLAQCRSLARFEQVTRELDLDQRRQAPLPGARDLADHLCQDEDLRLSTAALLSARFPYVSPTGALQRCGPPDERGDDPPFTYLVDGGYVDSSAASQTAAVLVALAELVRAENDDRREDGDPCIQPVVLQLDNGYEDEATAADPGRPIEAVAPPSGSGAVTSGRAQAGRQQLAETATTLLRGDAIGCPAADPNLARYLRLYPRSHPGVQAPMGWQLSAQARADLRDQLGTSANQCALLSARAWLEATTAPTDRQCVQGLVELGGVGQVGAELHFCVDGSGPDAGCTRTLTDPYGAFTALVEPGLDHLHVDLDDDGEIELRRDLGCGPTPVCTQKVSVPANVVAGLATD